MSTSYDVLVVGGGHGGAQTAVFLRENGFEGSIGIVSSEDVQPYERPPLSKAFLSGERTAEELALRPQQFWNDNAVDIMCGRTVTEVDAERHQITLDDGAPVKYGKLIWATGGEPRRLPGTENLREVFTFRTVTDAVAVKDVMSSATELLVVGGGFIGLEAAAAFQRAGVQVTVIEAQSRLLARVTSEPVSDHFAALHSAAGVQLRLATGIDAISQTDGALTAVTLDSGEVVPASVMLVGIGLVPNSETLEAAGAAASNGIDVDDRCRTSLPDVYAIGDVANFESPFSANGTRVRLESVPNTTAHARVVAADITGNTPPAPTVPWFWSHQYETKLQTAGLIHGYDSAIVRGDRETGRFSVAYLREGRLLGLDAINNVKDFVASKGLIGAHLNAEQVANSELKLGDCVAEPETVS